MMKRILLTVVALSAFFLSACATTATGQTTVTPAQVAAQVCPPLTSGLTVLQVAGVLDPKAQAELLVAVPIVNAVCAAGAVVDVSSIKSLGDTGVPALLKIIAASTLDDKDKAAATLAISTAHAIMVPVIQQIEAGQATTAAATVSTQ